VDFLNGTNFVVLPPVDAIQEFKVQTTDFSAEFGRSGAAVLNATIKSGTNSFHGAGWEFFRNDKLDAADYFERVGNTTKKGELRLNQFGVASAGRDQEQSLLFRRLRRTAAAAGSTAQGKCADRPGAEAAVTPTSQRLITGQTGTQTDALVGPCPPERFWIPRPRGRSQSVS